MRPLHARSLCRVFSTMFKTDQGRHIIGIPNGNGWRAADILNAVKDAQSLSVEDIHIIDPFANLAI